MGFQFCFGKARDGVRWSRGQVILLTHVFLQAAVVEFEDMPQSHSTPNIRLTLSDISASGDVHWEVSQYDWKTFQPRYIRSLSAIQKKMRILE